MHPSLYVVVLLVIHLLLVVVDCQYIVQTVAGNNVQLILGPGGDGGFATSAQLNSPRDVAVDASNNLFIADDADHRIRFVNKSTGIISTIVGTGSGGFSGDGGLATQSHLNNPFSVDVDIDGNLYISDSGNNVIRFVNKSTGIISTIVGTGSGGFSGDGGLATQAQLNVPRGIKVDSLRNIYIADTSNHVIRFVNRSSGIISTIAGIPQIGKKGPGDGGLAIDATLWNPFDVSVDSFLNVYITDSTSFRIRFVNKTSGIISTIAETGINYPNGVAVDSAFNVYIADTGNKAVKFINKTSNIISTIWENKTYSDDGNSLFGITVDSRGNVYITDTLNFVIRVLIKTCDGLLFHCNNHGTCLASNRCACDLGWNGEHCTYPICFGVSANETTSCSGKGKCRSPDMCECKRGVLGNNCQYYYCNRISSSEPSVCSGRGACVGIENCTCSANYFGDYCEKTTCLGINSTSDTVCSGKGRCISFNNCGCSNGYSGKTCEFTSCGGIHSSSPSVCSGNGYCSSYNNCTCNSGYIGDNCELHTCNGLASNDMNVCSNHGQCSQVDNCTCDSGYYDQICSSFNCNGVKHTESRCENNGTCSRPGKCSCVPGYEGDRCEFPVCYNLNSGDSAVCSSHGNCSSVNECVCNRGWRGLTCNITDCYGIDSFVYDVCSGNGKCVEKDVCSCDYGYAGEECELTLCFGKKGNETHTCSYRGECVLPNTCQCFSGYNGEECQHHEVIMDPDTVSIFSSHSNLMKEWKLDLFSCNSMFNESDIWKLGDSHTRKCHWRATTGFRIFLGYNHTVTNGLILPIMGRFTIKVNSSCSDSKRIGREMGITIGKTLDQYPISRDLLVRSDVNIDYHNFRETKQEWYCSSCSSEIQSILNRAVNKPIFFIPATNLSSFLSHSTSNELTLSSNSNNDLQVISSSSRRYIFGQSESLPVMFNVWNEVYLDNFIQDCVGHNCIIESSINGLNTSLTYTFNGFLIVLSKDFQDKQIFRIVNKFGNRLLENNYKGTMQVVGLNLISFLSSFYQVDLTFTAYDNIDVYLTNANKTYSKDTNIEIGTSIVDPFVYKFSSIEEFSYRWSCQNIHTMQWIKVCNISQDSTLYLRAGDLSVGYYHVVLYLTTSKSKYSFYSSLHITEFPQSVPSIVIRQHIPSTYPFGSRFSIKLSVFSETPIKSIDWVLLEGTLLTSNVQSLLKSSNTKKPLYGHNIELELNIESMYLIEGENYCFQVVAFNENGISSANISTVIDISPRFSCNIYDPLGEELAFLSKFVVHCVNTRESISSWWVDVADSDGNRLMILSNTGKKSFIARLPYSSSGQLNIGIKLINKNGSFSRIYKKVSINYPISEQSLTARVEFIVRFSKIILGEPISTDTSISIASLISFINPHEDFSQLYYSHRINLKNTLLDMISSLRKIQDISLNVDDKIIQLVLPSLTKIIFILESLDPNLITETMLGQWIKWMVKGIRSSYYYYTPCIMNHLLDNTHAKELKELFQILITKSSVSSFELLPQVLNIVKEYTNYTSPTYNFDFNDGGEGLYEEISHVQQLEGKHIKFKKNKNIEINFPLGIYEDLNQYEKTKMISYVYGDTQVSSSLLSPIFTLSLLSEIGDDLKVENLKNHIRIKFKELFIRHNDSSLLNVICVYYDYTSQSWINRGIVSEFNITKVEPGIIYFNMTCTTSHLTSFSVQQVMSRNTSSTLLPSSDQTITLILSIVIPLSVLLVISFMIITICLVVSFYRNRYWNKRIRNEKEMEQKLLDIELEINEKSQNVSYLIPIEEIQLMKKIGEGGFGQVYLAKWKQVQVAVKCVTNYEGNEILDEDDDTFEKEVLLLNSLKHPNVIHFFGVCLTETKNLMIMEFLEGGSLDRIISELRLKRRKMTIGEKIKILFGVSNGMSYLHNLKPKSIIHRDLKSANILLDTFMQPKVCDFGLSKLTGNNNSTKMTTNLGSIFYMAELIGEGGEKITNKLDVYSYGIIMYELLFEDNPFLNQSSQKINRFSQSEINELNSFSVPIKVSKGLRPKIPYSNITEQEIWISEFMNEERFQKKDLCRLMDRYISLMKQCWDTEPDIRPSFDSIGQYLADIMAEFHF